MRVSGEVFNCLLGLGSCWGHCHVCPPPRSGCDVGNAAEYLKRSWGRGKVARGSMPLSALGIIPEGHGESAPLRAAFEGEAAGGVGALQRAVAGGRRGVRGPLRRQKRRTRVRGSPRRARVRALHVQGHARPLAPAGTRSRGSNVLVGARAHALARACTCMGTCSHTRASARV